MKTVKKRLGCLEKNQRVGLAALSHPMAKSQALVSGLSDQWAMGGGGGGGWGGGGMCISGLGPSRVLQIQPP